MTELKRLLRTIFIFTTLKLFYDPLDGCLWFTVQFFCASIKIIDGRKIGDSVTGRDLKENIYDWTEVSFYQMRHRISA
jgi:hypothetical protein